MLPLILHPPSLTEGDFFSRTTHPPPPNIISPSYSASVSIVNLIKPKNNCVENTFNSLRRRFSGRQTPDFNDSCCTDLFTCLPTSTKTPNHTACQVCDRGYNWCYNTLNFRICQTLHVIIWIWIIPAFLCGPSLFMSIFIILGDHFFYSHHLNV